MTFITPIIPGERRYPTIVPFTIPDGQTYLNTLERLVAMMKRIIDETNNLSEDLVDIVVETLNTTIDDINQALADQESSVDDKIATLETLVATEISVLETLVFTEISDLQTYVNDKVQEVVDGSVTLQDPLMSELVENENSLVRGSLDDIYATKTGVQDDIGTLNTTLSNAINDVDDKVAGVVSSVSDTNGRIDTVDNILNTRLSETELSETYRSTDVFKVDDYGAVGDGVTDDRQAIQQALDASYTNNGGEVFFTPGKTYLINNTIIVRSNTIVTLYGATLLKGNSAFPWIRNFDAAEDNFPGFSGNGNIVFQGGTLNGRAQDLPNPSGNCLTFAHAENITVQDVTFLNACGGQTHALEFNAIKNGRAVNCNFFGYNSYGLAGEAIQVDIAVEGSGACLPHDETTCSDILVSGCVSDSSDDLGYFGALVGSHTARAGRRYFNIKVVNNTVHGSVGDGIRMYAWENSVVSGNHIFNTVGEAAIYCQVALVNGGIHASSMARNIIEGNVIRYAFNGIVVRGITGALVYHVSVNNNTVKDCSVDGINVSYVREITINGNRVDTSGEDGIQVSNSDRALVTSNVITDMTRYGFIISPESSNGIFSGNMLRNARGTAYIRLSLESNYNLLTGNIVRQSGSTIHAISISNGCTGTMFYGNDFRGGTIADAGSGSVSTAINRT